MNLTASETHAQQIQARRASVAVGVAPILVLLAFTLVVGGWIEPDIGFAVFVACTAWVVYEMYRYQDIDADDSAVAPSAHGDSDSDSGSDGEVGTPPR